MSRPNVVVFDLGKVLVDFDYSIAIRRFAERSEAGIEQIQQLVVSPIQVEYESGIITTDEFFEAIRHGAGFRGDCAEFVGIFADIFTPMETIIGFFNRLKLLGISTCIFSNTNEIATRHIREKFSFYSRFDNFVLSFEEGGMKPDEPIYEVVEQRTGECGAAILYIDDRPENIMTGKGRGWQTILQDDESASVARAEALLGL
jgi:putative hydrolase of the HAD superfamily|tara:strand:- start:103 stop:708 length:606 start_codon:yes stop_codon:yes gene_type:complete